MKYFLLFIFMSFSGLSQQQDCQKVTDWLYKDLTLNSLSSSYEVIKMKIMLAVLTSQKNTSKMSLSDNQALVAHYKTLLDNGNEFTELSRKYKPLRRYRFWSWWSYYKTQKHTLESAIYSWKNLQRTKPHYFKGLESKHLLNDWDMFAVKEISKLKNYQIQNKAFKDALLKITAAIKNEKSYTLTQKDINKLKQALKSKQKELAIKSQESYKKVLREFNKLCSTQELQELSSQCLSLNSENSDLEDNLAQLSHILQLRNYTKATKPTLPRNLTQTKDEVEKLTIHPQKYKTNPNSKAYYCKRSTDLLTSITVHHTATEFNGTPKRINKMHLERSTKNSPWYMVGYHYLISNNKSSSPKVSEGRPIEYKGAHAGGYNKAYTKKEFKKVNKYKMTCAHSEKEHSMQTPKSVGSFFQYPRVAHGNLTSVGIAFIGNYLGKYKTTVSGVHLVKSYPKSKVLKASTASLTKFAQLACKLQRQYPSIKTLHPHSYFKKTSCPGSVVADLNKIANIASQYGCQFKVVYKK